MPFRWLREVIIFRRILRDGTLVGTAFSSWCVLVFGQEFSGTRPVN